ncbi:hypothetical protein LTR56_016379 [Elasticomyces elasticus]|nr:hypothetical protein LTR56_016379 [Elasticomyces elasticus]KAK3636256.1 hypothetical protein LTR22_018776 [Elasticomyces elasticus]KAK4912076.1 hypothetical protein LTR49_019452 [Elasticomyces elasticus]KAK5751765.1 hypothetical protein LTS12_018179 [Elasticomyces elasticus]
MDGISGIASILTLVSFAGILAKRGRQLCVSVRDAPKEIQELTSYLLHIKFQLDRLHIVSASGHPDILDVETCGEIQDCLLQARDCLSMLEKLGENDAAKSNTAVRLRWALAERKQATRWLMAMHKVRDRLAFLLQVINLHTSSLTLAVLQDLKAATNPPVQPVHEGEDSAVEETLVAVKHVNKRRLEGQPWVSGSYWATLGVRGSLISTGQGTHTDYNLAARMAVPLSYLLGLYAVMMQISVRTFPLCPGKFKLLHGSSLALARLVTTDDEFITACDQGDVDRVRRLLLGGRGRSTDVTERNWTPLAYAIRSGSVETVQELLSNGADLETPLGLLQTTPLQWAIWHKQLDVTRLLLSEGASQDHISNIGWNVMFYCWPALEHQEQSMLDFLQVLSEDSVQDLEVVDTEGWTALHRVAAFGDPTEVLALIKLGARPEQEAMPLRWNALHHATFYGNNATFDSLLPYFADEVVTMVDARGWTLLHIAASAGHDEIVKCLLCLGADSNARSMPFWSHMPDSLHGQGWTPQEVAAAQSITREQQYVRALRTHDSKTAPATVQADLDVTDEFWEAYETIETIS